MTGSTFLLTSLPHELCRGFSVREINYKVLMGKLGYMQSMCACK